MCIRDRDYAFETLGAEKVFSIIRTDNLPSIRVAEGIGMRREREFMARYYAVDMRHYLYGCLLYTSRCV